jgi:hypothetical protein
MALSKSALSELLDALRAGGDLDVIREGLAVVLQALIEPRPPVLTAVNDRRAAPPTATALVPDCC